MTRTVVTIHLPMGLTKTVRIMKAVGREFPDSIIDQRLGDRWRVMVEDGDEGTEEPPPAPTTAPDGP